MTSPVPHAALVHHLIALGKTRSGKSSKLRVLVEQLLDEQAPVCIIDPKGDWYGLKSSIDGKRAGYALIIFGGEHADVPINAHSGAHVAELVATGNRPCIIDLGGWMVGERTRFFIEFASTLFKLSKGARHLVIDEVHNFAPQGKIHDPDAGKMLHWANRLASEGAGKGITIFAASQRPQKVSKDFITSCETLIACKVIHKLDRDAIKDWIDGCADPALGKQVIADLAQLEKPDAYVWCPEIDFGPKVVTFPLFKTYDSFKPQPADAGKLKGWAEVDLDDVKAKLATVVEEAKANDPRELKAKVAALNKEVQALRANPAQVVDPGAEERGFNRGLAYGQNLANNIRVALLGMVDANDKVVAGMESMLAQINGDDPGARFVYTGARSENPAPHKAAIVNAALRKIGTVHVDTSTSPSVRKILDVIHRSYPVSLSFDAAARRAAISSRSSAYGKYRDAIAQSAELVEQDGKYRSAPGFEASGSIDTLASLSEWVGKLPPSYGKMLSAIHEHGPTDRETIAAMSGVSQTSSGLGSGLRELMSLQLICEKDGRYQVEEGLR